MFIPRLDTAHIDLFPVDRHIVGFEDCPHGFRDFGANTVTYETLGVFR